eukprot:5948867-Pyramimonas_sp.AAC.1
MRSGWRILAAHTSRSMVDVLEESTQSGRHTRSSSSKICCLRGTCSITASTTMSASWKEEKSSTPRAKASTASAFSCRREVYGSNGGEPRQQSCSQPTY